MTGTSFFGSPLLLPPPPATAKPLRHHPTVKMSLNPNPISALTKLLWGKSLPPNLLISTARSAWSSVWHLMMSQLAPSDPTGGYTRPASQFRRTAADPSLSRRNLHLYVGLPCPWAHRTLIVRALKGLEESIPVSIAAPGSDGSWEFRDSFISDRNKDILVPSLDKANRCKNLKQVYNLRRGGYNGRSTVPMLWDADQKEVVCNESYDIIALFNSGVNEISSNPGLDLSPPPLKKKMDEWNQIIYPNINNGVYRCGFAQSQEAYDSAVNELFTTLDMVDEHLGSSRYLCGDALTLADVCLFTTLIRFDIVYNVLFKCTKKKLIEYPNLHGYMRDIYQIPKVAATCNLGAIMDGYYKMLFPLNPSSIRPAIPLGCEHEMLSKPHNRESLSWVERDVDALIS
ncbi:Glutathionyl-hydroquinone reductase YqjG [Sesamum alatum]|uniref:Glutathionyl-hydroquinone reductase YqjG n=1 Tax=Sesamum alatum TaxID=300844 RepID=A0AAE2D0Q1_9LAMI|nr:Glutathionyl-hydroquinone reductase YqjG [Sesamum alatum]